MYIDIPVKERLTRIFEGESSSFLHTKFVEVGGIGVIVEYDKKRNLILEKIKTDSCPIVDTNLVLGVNSLEEAITMFLQKKEARGEHPAIWIDEKRIIVKYPFCKFLNRSSQGRFICGPEISGGGGARGMCVLEKGNGIPLAGYCPVGKIDKTKVEKITIGGKEYFFVDVSKK
ncbi:MAG TPA: hypothetical protein PLD14_00165 [Candidatus Pacearchaeota archaeon]|nr:hypothetical protein [Candidatus Pacearchaeota archaeon]HPR79628.1 hypothetical protein [Candidatus Pacearchaeota archaeon]